MTRVRNVAFCLLFTTANCNQCEEQSSCSQNNAPNSNDTAAQRLADLINAGPVDVRNQFTLDELNEALGELVIDDRTGYRTRTGSFLELLTFTPPETLEDVDVSPHEPFQSPLLIQRTSGGGIAGFDSLAVPTLSDMKRANPPVRPSRCASLAINYGPSPQDANGNWNSDLMPFGPYSQTTTFSKFHQQISSEFDLRTEPRDNGNVQLQTHGIRGDQLAYMNQLIQRTNVGKQQNSDTPLYTHPVLDQSIFKVQVCTNPPQLGFASSLRGLPFHSHAANWNEVIWGRKLWLLFPPRNAEGLMAQACPWPLDSKSWKPNGMEDASGDQINTILSTFFGTGYRHEPNTKNATSSPNSHESLPLRSCHDQSLTPLQWLVYEYPRLPIKYRPLIFLANPGEVLFIPHFWLHMTLNLDDTMYATQAACSAQPTNSQKLMDKAVRNTKRATRRTCRETGKFCEGYCHALLCYKCDGWDCGCPGL